MAELYTDDPQLRDQATQARLACRDFLLSHDIETFTNQVQAPLSRLTAGIEPAPSVSNAGN